MFLRSVFTQRSYCSQRIFTCGFTEILLSVLPNLPRKYHTKLVWYIGVRHAVTLAESSIQFQLNRAYAITNWWFLMEFTLCFTTWRFISACLHREVIVHSGLLLVIIRRSHRARHRPSNQDYQQQQVWCLNFEIVFRPFLYGQNGRGDRVRVPVV